MRRLPRPLPSAAALPFVLALVAPAVARAQSDAPAPPPAPDSGSTSAPAPTPAPAPTTQTPPASAPAAASGEGSFPVGRVVQVVLVPPLAGEDAWARSGLRPGEPLDRARARRALETALASGTFAEARASARAVPDGVSLVIQGERRVRAREVAIEGVDARTLENARADLAVLPGSWLSEADLSRALERLRQGYRDAGFASTRVTAEWQATEDSATRALRVSVREGRPTRVRRVVFEGVPADASQAVSGAVGFGPGDVADPAAARRAFAPVSTALRQAGYLSAHIEQVRFVPAGRDRADAVVSVRAGPRYQLEWRGVTLFPTRVLAAALQLEDERGLDATTLNALVVRVRDYYVRRGYLDASARAEVRQVNPARAVLAFTVREGAQVLVHDVAFPGATHVDVGALRDILHDTLLGELPGGELLQDPRGQVEAVLDDRPGFSAAGSLGPRVRLDAEHVYVPDLYVEAARRMVVRLREQGFLDAAVGPPEVRRVRAGARAALAVSFPVREGARTLFDELAFEGNASVSSADLARVARLRLGGPLSFAELDAARAAIVEEYRERGHLFARAEPTVDRSPDHSRARVRFVVHEGPEVRVGRVIVRGNERTLRGIILERVTLRPGEVYRPSLVQSTQRQLGELGAFSGITVGPADPDVEAPVKDVIVQLVELGRFPLEGRIGFSTAEGVRAGAEFAWRNIGGTGLTGVLRGQIGYQVFFPDDEYKTNYQSQPVGQQLRRRASLSLVAPALPLLGPAFRATLDVSYQRLIERQFAIEGVGGSFSLAYHPSRFLTVVGTQELQWNSLTLLGASSIADAIAKTLAITPPGLQTAELIRLGRLLLLPTGTTTLSATRVNITIDARDQLFNPQNGVVLSLMGEYVKTLDYNPSDQATPGAPTPMTAVTPPPGDTLRGTVSATGYYRLPFLGIVLASNLRVGANLTFEPSDCNAATPGSCNVTYTNRLFFLGGSDSMRGWLQDTFIPQDVLHPPAHPCDPSVQNNLSAATVNSALLAQRGGDAFFLWRNEVRVPIGATNFALGVFLDAGNLWKSRCEFNPLVLRADAGLGVRYITPIGPVALDVGFNLDPQVIQSFVPGIPGVLGLPGIASTSEVDEALAAVNFSIGTF